MTNTGNFNTGYRNTGNYNTGDHNNGDRNTGNLNTGDYNTGYFNTGNCNTGYRNTGDHNTGGSNTGNRNTGNRNVGNYNTGDYNTGDYNTGDYHVGCFNTNNAEKVYYFNTLMDRSEWDAAEKPLWIYRVRPTEWVNSDEMTDTEKTTYPAHKTTGGYLREKDPKQAWAEAFDGAALVEIELTKALPAFDAEVFLKITGIDLRDEPETAPLEANEICINGVVYVRKEKGEKK